ncbi:MAG: hypothetical protein MJZ97_09050 [Bacteroidales bacterium]|nr:hypothetical protein [Bacteroidales bacterium]
MSVYSLYSSPIPTRPYSKRFGVTLLQSRNVLENDIIVKKSELVRVDPRQSPYNGIMSSEYSLDAIIVSGGNPSQVFVASRQVDDMIKSVESVQKSLSHVL